MLRLCNGGLAGEGMQFQTVVGHGLVAWREGGADSKQCVVYHLFYYYCYCCFLSLHVIQVNSPHLNPHGFTVTFFPLSPPLGVGRSE